MHNFTYFLIQQNFYIVIKLVYVIKYYINFLSVLSLYIFKTINLIKADTVQHKNYIQFVGLLYAGSFHVH